VSDDDYARVVHTQDWALDPRFDATGTSWLPFPFWVSGGLMRIMGPSLDVARGVALLWGLASAALIYAAARMLISTRRDALSGALVAAVFPWCARLGVAPVPELPSAALSLFAVATLARPDGRLRLLGAAALFCACLSRYEPWPVACLFVLLTLVDLATNRLRESYDEVLGGIAILTAVSGPLWWIAHNANVHGNPFHFLARVSAYKRAVGGESAGPLTGYPLSLLREEPELCAAFGLLLIWQLARRRFALAPDEKPAAVRTCAIGIFLVATLSLAALPGGAPTHHAGRAVLLVWLLLAIYAGAWGRRLIRPASAPRIPLAILLIAALVLSATVLRPWYARLDAFTPRSDEIAFGRGARPLVGDGARVLVEANDFRHFAIQAASGHPHRLTIDRSLDPRGRISASSFTTYAALQRRAHEIGAALVIAHESDATRHLGVPLASAGPWHLWRIPSGT